MNCTANKYDCKALLGVFLLIFRRFCLLFGLTLMIMMLFVFQIFGLMASTCMLLRTQVLVLLRLRP